MLMLHEPAEVLDGPSPRARRQPERRACWALANRSEQTWENPSSAQRTARSEITPPAAELVRAVAEQRDPLAFAELYAFYAPRVRDFMQRGGRSPDQAEDLAQETMARVWRMAGRYDPNVASLSAWIFTIARNLRIDRFRGEQTPASWVDGYVATVEETHTPEVHYEIGERARQVREALRQMPPEQCAVLQMSYFGDLTQVEIASRLGLPLGTVKSRVRLALGRLRALID